MLHSGLNPAWHFWLSTRFSCCLKILGYIREQFYRFSRGCKPRENIWNCSRKYTKMFKTDSFLGNKKLSLNQNVWRDHNTMDVLLHFLGDISILNSDWNMRTLFCCLALELFHCLPLWKTGLFVSSRAFSVSTPTFSLSTPVDNSEATWKKATKAIFNCDFIGIKKCRRSKFPVFQLTDAPLYTANIWHGQGFTVQPHHISTTAPLSTTLSGIHFIFRSLHNLATFCFDWI